MLPTLLFALAGLAAALPGPANRFESNIAYRSPSLTVRAPHLEYDTHELTRRHAKRNSDGQPYYKYNLTFPYGVASGDPYEDSVILWTVPQKVTNQNAYPPICLLWVVAPTNSTFKLEDSVQHGYVETTEDVRYSTKVEASGLKPYTKYYYRFESCAGAQYGVSPVGSFKTLPSADSTPEKVTLATFSCSNYPAGYFQAYGYAAANPDLDWIQHLGDYIYEYKPGDYGTVRSSSDTPKRELSSLEDYRDRHANYKLDPDLQAAHQAVAWQTVWDDHEVADNTWKGGSADSNNTVQGQIGDYQFSDRKAHATRAYFEWMPIRQVDTDDKLRIWRSFKIGKLADMIMLDTRQYDRDITDVYYNTQQVAAMANDTDRSLTGDKQQNWFLNKLSESTSTWKLVMQQIVFGPVNYGAAFGKSFPTNYDSWDGYTAERARILNHVADNKINNTVILSGDSHATWVHELAAGDSAKQYDPQTGANSVAVEFAGSAVSSPSSYGHGPAWNATRYRQTAEKLVNGSAGLAYAEGWLRGGFFLTVTPNATTATYFGYESVETHNQDVKLFANFSTAVNSQKLTRPFGAIEYGALKQ